MVDNEMRIAAATAICEYLDGVIGSYDLDDAMCKCRASNDATCNEICSAVWYFHSDCEDHKNAGKWQMAGDYERMVQRWIDILRSNWEMAEPVRVPFLTRIRRFFMREPLPFNRNKFWPFNDEGAWNTWRRSET